MNPNLKHLVIVVAMTIFVAVLYQRIPGTYFCGYDDFNEIHRAAFEETKQPIRILTATHFNSYKYRPLSHALNFVTYKLSNGSATLFRIRNVLFHLMNIALVYGIGWLLLKSYLTSGAAALLFGVHPLVNQPLVAASFTIPGAHIGFLFSIFCFVLAVNKKKGWSMWLCLALFASWLAILTYESSISTFPIMIAYLVIRCATQRKMPVSPVFLKAFALGTVLVVGSYLGMRTLFVEVAAKQAVPSIQTMTKAAVMYSASLVLPVDSVLANEWFGAPLPSEIQFGAIPKVWLALFLVVIFATIVVVMLRKQIIERLYSSEWASLLFLLAASILSLLPYIVLTPKPSETYVYLTVAFFGLFVCGLLKALLAVSEQGPRRTVYIAVVGVLAISFSCATWVRNNRVVKCGVTAERIVTGLRQERLEKGPVSVTLAASPNEPLSRRYGIYGWRGIDTIGEPGMKSAVQWANDNEQLKVKVEPPGSYSEDCNSAGRICLWVHDDGTVVDAHSSK